MTSNELRERPVMQAAAQAAMIKAGTDAVITNIPKGASVDISAAGTVIYSIAGSTATNCSFRCLYPANIAPDQALAVPGLRDRRRGRAMTRVSIASLDPMPALRQALMDRIDAGFNRKVRGSPCRAGSCGKTQMGGSERRSAQAGG